MKMSEYTRAEWKKMKDKPFKERLAFFWDYYKIPTIIVVAALLAVIYTATIWITAKDEALNGMLINSTTAMEESAILQDFCQEAGINTKKEEIVLNAGLSMDSGVPSMDYMTYQRIHAGIAARQTDFFIADQGVMRQCGYDPSHMLMDLREFLSPEQLETLKDRIYYIDGSMCDGVIPEGETVTYPSPTEPETMKDPIPVGIDIQDCRAFLDSYYPTNQPLYFAVAVNAPHKDRALQFLEFIMEHTNKE